MTDEFVPLGLQSSEQIEAKLRELEGEEKSVDYGLESRRRRPWLNTQHQFGFIAPFTPGEKRYYPIRSANNMLADDLVGERLNIRLDYLRIFEYPTSLFDFGDNVHSILFTFEARNQVENGKEEPVAFNQLYNARVGQDAAVTGQPIFIGLTVGANGINFSCRTVNVANSTDEQLISIFNSETVTSGLNLLTTAQPALGPLLTVARGLCVSLASRRRNVPVQEVKLGLDFEDGALGARLAVGSYVVAQTERADDITWNEWMYDAETGSIMRAQQSLADGELAYPLPYNAFVFRVSRYTE